MQGTVLTFNCVAGYQLEEARDTVTCHHTWSRPLPRCRPVTCPAPATLNNGQTEVAGTEYGQVATYSCGAGHQLLGPRTSTCTQLGEWQPPPPSCAPVDCGEAAAPGQGSVVPGPGAGQDTRYLATLAYSCHPGYTLRGPATRTCTQEGVWSGDQPE